MVGKVSEHFGYPCACACWKHLVDINVFFACMFRSLVELDGMGMVWAWYAYSGH